MLLILRSLRQNLRHLHLNKPSYTLKAPIKIAFNASRVILPKGWSGQFTWISDINYFEVHPTIGLPNKDSFLDRKYASCIVIIS